jgi:twitching motility protein PilT
MLHLSSKKPPIMRINGSMVPVTELGVVSAEQVKTMIYAIMTDTQRAQFEAELELDFALSFGEEMRFRVNAFNTLDGPAAVFRTIPTKISTLEQINAPGVLQYLCNKHRGLILVTGPTGSGKSTTLAAMINHINETKDRHIITIEDPVEFVHQSKKSLINQREVGVQTKSYARALKSSLREDPDVILIGEMRDLETMHLALTAAETGHLVFATLHTSSAAKTIDRIIDVFPAGEKEMIRSMLATSVEAIIAQTLVKKKDGSGRVAAHEILLGIPSVRNLIREGMIAQIPSVMQINSRLGMITMKDALYKLASDGVVDKNEIKSYFTDKLEEDIHEASAAQPSIIMNNITTVAPKKSEEF